MKILFITFRFPPYKSIGAIRTGKIADELKELGHEIKVISARNQNLPEELETKIDKENLYYTNWLDVNLPLSILGNKKESFENISKSPKLSYKSNFIKKMKNFYKIIFHNPDGMIGWYPFGLKKGKNIIESWKPDVIYASASPYTSLIIASKLSKIYNIPWVGELRDLWSENHYRYSSFLDKKIEKNTLMSASALISVSEILTKKLSNNYSMPCFTIQNGFDLEDWEGLYSEKNENEKIRIIHTGSLYEGKRDPSILFNIIKNNKDLLNNIEINFYGNNLEWVNKLSRDMAIEQCVNVYPSIERKKILQLQASSDILLLLTWDNILEEGVLTGKIFEYIASETPILSMGAINDIASKLVTDNGFGKASNDSKIVKDFILNIKNPEYKKEFNQNIKLNKYKFDRKYQTFLLEEILKKAIRI